MGAYRHTNSIVNLYVSTWYKPSAHVEFITCSNFPALIGVKFHYPLLMRSEEGPFCRSKDKHSAEDALCFGIGSSSFPFYD